MKRFLSMIMALVIIATMIPAVCVFAATEGDYTYIVENGEVTITDVDTSISGEVVIPDTLDGYPVTSIGEYAFSNCKGLTGITISDRVTSIGSYAFYECTELISIKIPDSVTNFGRAAFSNCTSLTSIAIPNGITSIVNSAFIGCTSLISITIPDSVTYIGFQAFFNCTNLTSIIIPYCVTHIDIMAFDGCKSISDVYYGGSYISKQNISIGNNNDYLTNATWHYADNEIFVYKYNDETLSASIKSCAPIAETVIIPDTVIKDGKTYTVTSIDYHAFYNCTNLTSITIPDSVISIGNIAFHGCTNLTNITIPDSVTKIGDEAFYECTSLISITIPDSVREIGNEAFYKCTGLTDIIVGTGNNYYSSENGILFDKTKAEIICYPAGKDDLSYIIPDNVTSVGKNAFEYCAGLTSISIPDSVTSIGSGAFSGCTGLTSISIPDSVTSIGSGAFSGCTGLTSITIPESITTLGSGAFWYCAGLTSITIIDGMTSINSQTFFGCDKLTSIIIPDSVITIGDMAFFGCFDLTIYCYENSYAHSYAIENNISYVILCKHNVEAEGAKPATCTTDGYTGDGVCTVCGEEVIGKIIPSPGHTEGEWVIAIEPTTTTEGLRTKSCTVCGEVIAQESIPVLAPSFTSGDADGDGNITLSDVTLLLQKIAGWNVEIVGDADANADGNIDLNDVTLLLQYIAGWNVTLG